MRQGMQELEQWLRDLVYLGLAELPTQPITYWQQRRARLVDAKLAGVANRIETLESLLHGPEWQDQVTLELGRLYLLCRAFEKLDHLAPEGQDELLLQLGVTQKRDQVLTSSPIDDTWVLIGQRTEVHPRWDLQRLWWQSQKQAKEGLILEFSIQGRGFNTIAETGASYLASFCYYPGNPPQRGIFAQKEKLPEQVPIPPRHPDIDSMLDKMSVVLAENPFISQAFATVSHLIPISYHKKSYLLDIQGNMVPVAPGYPHWWNLISLSGGYPVDLAFEWDGYQAWPLSHYREEGWHPLN